MSDAKSEKQKIANNISDLLDCLDKHKDLVDSIRPQSREKRILRRSNMEFTKIFSARPLNILEREIEYVEGDDPKDIKRITVIIEEYNFGFFTSLKKEDSK